MRKGGGEEARSVKAVAMCVRRRCDGDRAAVGVDVHSQGSSVCEDETHFPLAAW